MFQLSRENAFFAFAGDAQYAYPLLMQMLRSRADEGDDAPAHVMTRQCGVDGQTVTILGP